MLSNNHLISNSNSSRRVVMGFFCSAEEFFSRHTFIIPKNLGMGSEKWRCRQDHKTNKNPPRLANSNPYFFHDSFFSFPRECPVPYSLNSWSLSNINCSLPHMSMSGTNESKNFNLDAHTAGRSLTILDCFKIRSFRRFACVKSLIRFVYWNEYWTVFRFKPYPDPPLFIMINLNNFLYATIANIKLNCFYTFSNEIYQLLLPRVSGFMTIR